MLNDKWKGWEGWVVIGNFVDLRFSIQLYNQVLKIRAVLKATILTVLYVAISELLGAWILIPYWLHKPEFTENYFGLISGILILAVIYFFTEKQTKHLLNLKFKDGLKWNLTGIVSGIFYPFVQYPLISIYNLISKGTHRIGYKFDGYLDFLSFNVVNFISTIILIPIAEELFFRGVIQNKLQEKLNPILSIILSSILFGLMHLKFENLLLNEPMNFQLAYITFFGGLILGTLFHKSKSLIPPILAHLFWNLTVHLC